MNRNSDYFFYVYTPIVDYDEIISRLINSIKKYIYIIE